MKSANAMEDHIIFTPTKIRSNLSHPACQYSDLLLKKQKANKQKNKIKFCDTDHGMHSVLRKGEPKVLTCVEPFDFSNILLGRFSRIALGLRANSEFKASFCQSLAV